LVGVNIGVKKIADYFIPFFFELFNGINGTVGTTDMEENFHLLESSVRSSNFKIPTFAEAPARCPKLWQAGFHEGRGIPNECQSPKLKCLTLGLWPEFYIYSIRLPFDISDSKLNLPLKPSPQDLSFGGFPVPSPLAKSYRWS
jgi:hypothetical protein